MPAGKYDRLPSLRSKWIGKRFDRLVVIDIGERQPSGSLKMLCQCDCGNTKEIDARNLASGATHSCGCWNKDSLSKRKKHGKSHSPEWSVWKNMIHRCIKPNNKKYMDYGGRGISVCQEWMKFENFWRDMGDKPSPDHQIDRIDNDLGYFKENCRWVTKSTNMLNRGVFSNSKTGVKGVRKAKNRYLAELKINGVKVLSKYFKTIEEAIAARLEAEKEFIK